MDRLRIIPIVTTMFFIQAAGVQRHISGLLSMASQTARTGYSGTSSIKPLLSKNVSPSSPLWMQLSGVFRHLRKICFLFTKEAVG